MRFILACVIVLCLGCAAVAPLTEQHVVVLSDAYAKTQGYNLAHYKRPSVHFNYTRADNTWVVFYDPIPDKKGLVAIGDDFTVYVENGTKKVSLIPDR